MRAVFTLVVAMDLLFVALAIGVVNVDPDSASAAGRVHAKVAIIVGPVGSLTPTYRRLADDAAAAARAMTDQVVTVYSPDATWPAARNALTDASIIVYLGHGNGWPSPYRDSLFRRSQNGLGLNPVAGVNDEAHQYFGEAFVSQVRLAPGAVVVLSHLCYASGNGEPGAAEPTVDVARQRADNYAAGWMAAGASAVIADGHGSPTTYVKALLRGHGTIETAWASAPNAHDHQIAFSSVRTTGAMLTLDPDHASAGFYRSLTVLPGARIADTLRGAATIPLPQPMDREVTRPQPTADPLALASRGATFGTPVVAGRPVANGQIDLTIPVDRGTVALLPDGVTIGVRWDDLARRDPTLAPDDVSPSAAPANATSSDGPVGSQEPIPSPDAGPPVETPPAIDLIDPETPGTEVRPATARRTSAGLTVRVTVPAEPGLYRLVPSIHDPEGVAYDAATQDLLGALIVQVSGSVWAMYGVQPSEAVVAGATFSVPVHLSNTGTTPWSMPWSDRFPLLVARWVALDDVSTFVQPSSWTSVDPVIIDPGSSVVIQVAQRAPRQAGRYLLLLDVQDGDGTSLASAGRSARDHPGHGRSAARGCHRRYPALTAMRRRPRKARSSGRTHRRLGQVGPTSYGVHPIGSEGHRDHAHAIPSAVTLRMCWTGSS